MRLLLIAATLLSLHTTALAGPEIHVRIASVTDAAERAAHVALVKKSLGALDAQAIDVVVTKLVVLATGEVSARIEVVLSTAGGMRSVAAGTATFIATKQQLRNQAALRKEALDYALAALHRRVRSSRFAGA